MTPKISGQRVVRGGFTAIEMLIVVVVIGVMAAAVMPRISRIVAEERVRKLQGAVATDLELAFAMASRQRKPVTVTYNASARTLDITDVATGTVLKSRYLGQSQSFSTTGAAFRPSGGITIFPAGLATAACTVVVANGDFRRRVAATRAGLVTKS
jgi:prepilin-type N-terminal cleavage/methylation domain-containing protein